jgi:transposase
MIKDRAILAVDLARKGQAAVVCDHDSVVLGRRMFTGSAWCIEQVLAWAVPVAARAGFAGLVLTCGPAGHQWKPRAVTSDFRWLPAVCVQPLLVRRAREGEDFTRSQPDFGDAVIIAPLTSELRCQVPYLPALNGAEDSYGFGLSAALVVPMGSADEAGWSAAAPCR